MRKKLVPGAPYEVWDDGTVHSLRTGRALKPTAVKNRSGKVQGYYVMLTDDGGREVNRRVDLLVAEAFLDGRRGGRTVRLDGDGANHAASNLAWEEGTTVVDPPPSKLGGIPGFPGYYATPEGRVYSRRGFGDSELREVAQKMHQGRMEVTLTSPGGKRQRVRVATCVLLVHAGARPTPRHQGRHLDDNQANNRLENLAWGTALENAADKWKNGGQPVGERAPNARFPDSAIGELLSARGQMSTAEASAKFGMSQEHVRRIWKGRRRNVLADGSPAGNAPPALLTAGQIGELRGRVPRLQKPGARRAPPPPERAPWPGRPPPAAPGPGEAARRPIPGFRNYESTREGGIYSVRYGAFLPTRLRGRHEIVSLMDDAGRRTTAKIEDLAELAWLGRRELPEGSRPVARLEGCHASPDGRIFSSRLTLLGFREVSQSPDGSGYMQVTINGRKERAHALVCEAFRGPCPPGKETRHLNGVRTDNRESNLAWGDRIEQAEDRRGHGTLSRGEAHPRAALSDKEVAAIAALEGKALQKDVAAAFGISQGHVSGIWRGEARAGAARGPRASAPRRRRGPARKLTADQEREVIAMKGRALQREVAAAFGIHQSHVSALWLGRKRAA